MSNRKNLSLMWTKHLKTKKEKEDFEKYIRNSSLLLDRQRAIIEEKFKNFDNLNSSINQFDVPSWSERRAWIDGYIAALRFIKDLTVLT